MSLRDQILQAKELQLELRRVSVPEWGADVFIRGWTGIEREHFERDFAGKNGDSGNVRARVLVRALLDESGARIFTDEDAERLGAKSADVIGRLFGEVMKLSGVQQQDLDAAEKN